ncbi:hypothetical protein [Candidatus Sororendozoicomonas aggregata]
MRDENGQPVEASFTPMFAGYINDVNTVLGNHEQPRNCGVDG